MSETQGSLWTYFLENLPDIRKKYEPMFVILHDMKVVGGTKTFEAAEIYCKRFEEGEYLIQPLNIKYPGNE